MEEHQFTYILFEVINTGMFNNQGGYVIYEVFRAPYLSMESACRRGLSQFGQVRTRNDDYADVIGANGEIRAVVRKRITS